MPTSSAGNSGARTRACRVETRLDASANRSGKHVGRTPRSAVDAHVGPLRRGVTLLEMLIVVTIISIIVSLSVPAFTAGLSGVRLASASSETASFLTSSMNTVERREQAEAIVLSPKENRLDVFTAASGANPVRTYRPPTGITFEGDEPHRYLLFPGGAFPRISLVLRNERGARRSVEIDPVTAVPQVRRIEDGPQVRSIGDGPQS